MLKKKFKHVGKRRKYFKNVWINLAAATTAAPSTPQPQLQCGRGRGLGVDGDSRRVDSSELQIINLRVVHAILALR